MTITNKTFATMHAEVLELRARCVRLIDELDEAERRTVERIAAWLASNDYPNLGRFVRDGAWRSKP